MWTSSTSKDKPQLQITPVSADAVQLSPLEVSALAVPDAQTSSEGGAEADEHRKIVVSFADLMVEPPVSAGELLLCRLPELTRKGRFESPGGGATPSQ